MVRVRRGDVDYPIEFLLSPDEFKSILAAGGIKFRKSGQRHDFQKIWERLLIQYVERATFKWPDYQDLKSELERLSHAASKGHRAFAKAWRALDLAEIDPTKAMGEQGRVRPRPPHKDEALDIIEQELTRQLGEHWQVFLDDERLDLNAIRDFLRRRLLDYTTEHGRAGDERQPDLEWFIDQAADLCCAVGLNVAANGRFRRKKETKGPEERRGGPFVRVIEQSLEIASRHADQFGISLPARKDIGGVVRGVIAKKRDISAS